MSITRSIKSRLGGPAWEVAELFPTQGQWSEFEYLTLPGNRLVEYCNGRIEVLPMPGTLHQFIVAFLYESLIAHVRPQKLGEVLFAALPVRLWSGKFREPDVLFMLAEHTARIRADFWEGADLVMEVVSRGKKDRHRDLIEKREDYAKAGIPEYWIIEPAKAQITVLRLTRGKYAVAGKYGRGDTAKSVLLDGFGVSVNEVFRQKAGNGK